MAMENQPFEDVSPIKGGDFPDSHVSLQGDISKFFHILCSEAKRRSPLEPSGRYQPYSPRHGSNLLRPKIFQFLFAISWGVGPLDSHEFEKYLFTLSNHLYLGFVFFLVIF